LRPGTEPDLKDRPKEYALEYAGFWIRLAAALIDFLLLIAGLYILYCVISQSFFWIFPSFQKVIDTCDDIIMGAPPSAGFIWLLATMLLVLMIGCTAYYVACWAATGQTVGKLALGIKVIRTDSSPLDAGSAFIRFLACLLCLATLGIGFILLAFDSRRQGLHDRIADTYVVKLPVRQVVYDPSLVRGGVR
jgi:uncharacterized RDD family membrane protein YckC